MLVVLKDNKDILTNLKNEKPVIIYKNFIGEENCNEVRKYSHNFTKKNLPKIGNRFKETFWRLDVLPSKVQTNRIFRTICFNDERIENFPKVFFEIFNNMKKFQNKYLNLQQNINSDFKRRPQIIHYPVGGGFFDWHNHRRFPNNYGLILNLSKKKREFNSGQTEIKLDDNQILKVDDHADIGDLILFRYDLPHRVAPCDPEKDLEFSANGRSTAVLPILNEAE